MRPLSLLGILFTLFVLIAACGQSDAKQKDRINPAELVYHVPEMHCDRCVKSISTALAELPGVDSVHVSLDSYTAYVKVDTSSSNKATLVKTIEGLGYSASLQ